MLSPIQRFTGKKLSNRKPTANTVRNTRKKKLYAECGVRLKNFHSSNFLSIWKPIYFGNQS